MFSSKTLALLSLLVPFTLAQYGGGPAPAPAPAKTSTPAAAAAAAPSSTGTTTSSAASNTQTVIAGKNGIADLSYTPSTVTAAPGTFVEFQFMPLNHSVAESAFDTPCSPVNASTFFAGFQFSTTTNAASNVFTLQINNTDPIWFYCPQTVDGIHHCTNGMVGVINPPATGNNLTGFTANAKAANTTVVVPAQIQGGVVAAASAVSSSSSATASASASAASSTPSGSASHLTVEMGLMGLVGIAFSALLSF